EVYGNYGTPATSSYAPGILDQTLAPVSYPPSTAKVPGAGPITFVYTADESGIQRRMAELIQQRLNAAGFNTTLKEVQNPQVYDYVNDLKNAPDMLLMTNTPAPTPTPPAPPPPTRGRASCGGRRAGSTSSATTTPRSTNCSTRARWPPTRRRP